MAEDAEGEVQKGQCNIFAMWNYPSGPPMLHGKGLVVSPRLARGHEAKVYPKEFGILGPLFPGTLSIPLADQ